MNCIEGLNVTNLVLPLVLQHIFMENIVRPERLVTSAMARVGDLDFDECYLRYRPCFLQTVSHCYGNRANTTCYNDPIDRVRAVQSNAARFAYLVEDFSTLPKNVTFAVSLIYYHM